MVAGAGPRGVPAREKYARYREMKLRSRKQGIDGPPQEYFYKIMNLCLQQKTCNEFLSAIELRFEAAELANKREWAVAMMAVEAPKRGVSWADLMEDEEEEKRRPGSPALASGKVKKTEGTTDAMMELLAAIKQLQTKMVALKMKSGTKVGHISKFCGKKKQKEEGGGTGKAIGMLRADSGKKAGSEGIPLLLKDLGQLVTKEVVVKGEKVEAVIDTGAAVSVITPSTVGLAIHAGGCPSIVMVNGQKAPPLESVEFAVEIAGTIVATKAIVLDMKGIRLLLGNDTLKKFKRLEKQYGEGRPKLWLG
ncbi:hypothetical protein OUZ56_030061 [Daphnia magna]|uniref:Peptidase A2 domain-containing protein n=1 Tax=Daphnia magna TaxID=35525 RepID=A0ABQ9ZQV1_9CRUS|nr:hypothetical protein OUZ56_030061 [Daphnia magna]